MNISGPAVATAWRAFQREYPGAALVVLHDELESALGVSGEGGGGGYTRVGVGIGRPVAREGGEVAKYVLRKMTGGEREALEGCVGGVMEELERLLEGERK
ncbi:aminoacyl-tRNA hydrolase [Pseudogymnoascus destructans]|uniref:Aminoacyl-tRNA hydrolase n=1 Tax=Pseudogymnoascus destructans TaxID=655981 RepID=A0A177APP2_9PEZI|nr:aminoacyl-tRNA hydrolase [Pseudogymnoascus destructans]OAF63184.1 aminoacyl-tRNA hydrolase [Pseudogymnoascus destructans]